MRQNSEGLWPATLGGWGVDVLAGSVTALLTISYCISYASLIFAGPLEPGLPLGVGLCFLGSIVVGLYVALRSSVRVAIGSLDTNAIAVMGVMMASVAADMRGAPMEQLIATVVVGLVLTGFVTAAVLIGLGYLRAGRFVRFVPFQVIAGFLGASGVLLLLGALTVTAGHTVTLGSLALPGFRSGLVVAVGVAAVLFALRRVKSPLVLPVVILVAIVLCHALAQGLAVSGLGGLTQGWFADPPADVPLPLPWIAQRLDLVNWGALAARGTDVLAVVLVSALTLLINVTALESALNRDVDLDRELRVSGAASLLASAAGTTLGYLLFSRTLVVTNAGARSPVGPIVAALLAGAVGLGAPDAIHFIPRPVLGGLLMYLGLLLVLQWVVQSRERLSRMEWLTVLAVVAITVRFGYGTGMLAGLLIGCITFSVAYSRNSPIRARYAGDVAFSQRERPPAERAALRAHAAARLVVHLQGFLFFGTANRVLQEIRADLAYDPGALRYLVLDFSEVSGLDSSATASFERLSQVLAAAGVQVGVCGVSPDVAAVFHPGRFNNGTGWQLFDTLDLAVEWTETALLSELPDAPGEALLPALRDELGAAAAAAFEEGLIEVREVEAGTVLVEQGEASCELIFLESGTADVMMRFGAGKPVRVRRLAPGAMIGEIGFILDLPRTATVVTQTPCRILRLDQAVIRRLEKDRPDVAVALYRMLIRRVAARILDKDEQISALMRTGLAR